jgi:hypothetical protein
VEAEVQVQADNLLQVQTKVELEDLDDQLI